MNRSSDKSSNFGTSSSQIACEDAILSFKFLNFNKERYIGITCEDGRIHLYDVDGKILRHTFPQTGAPKKHFDIKFTCLTSNQTHIYAGTENGYIYEFTENLQKPRTFIGHQFHVTCLNTNNQNQLLSSDLGGFIIIWDVNNAHQLAVFQSEEDHASLSACWWGNKVIASYTNGSIRIYNIKHGRETEIASNRRSILSISIHPTRNALAVVGDDSFVNVFSLQSLEKRNEIKCLGSFWWRDRTVSGVAWFQDILLCTSYDSKKIQYIENLFSS